jgi:hypothetical protein
LAVESVKQVSSNSRLPVRPARRCSPTSPSAQTLETYAAALFDVVGKGIVKGEINQRHALADAGKAHADIEARRTTGTTVPIP